MNTKPVTDITSSCLKSPQDLKALSDLCFVGGFLSIIGSILAWGARRATANEGHAERFGIFIGLWAPTFFILSNRLERYAERARLEQGS